jgi:hypothetical protein
MIPEYPLKRELEVTDMVLSSATEWRGGGRRFNANQAQTDSNGIGQNLQLIYGTDYDLLSDQNEWLQHSERVCEMLLAYYQATQNLPRERQVNLLRYMLSDSVTNNVSASNRHDLSAAGAAMSADELKWTIAKNPAKRPRRVNVSRYSATGNGHWIDSILDDGNLIKLEDGSLWEVSPSDAGESGVWTESSEITVIAGGDPGYPYRLVNTDDNEVVRARLISE